MAKNSIEDRLNKLELELERTQAVIQCQNLMSRVSWLHTMGLHSAKEFFDLFTSHTPDAKVEMTWGVYEGMKAAKKCAMDHVSMEGEGATREKGQLHMHTLTTPIIEVARDGKTAKGVWISPGIETGRVDGKMKASWCWLKYGVDFIKEDGIWKIWHQHNYEIFTCPYDKSWVEANENIDMTKVNIKDTWASMNKPNRPPATRWSYSPDAVYPTDQPWLPFPYETWDDSLSYVI